MIITPKTFETTCQDAYRFIEGRCEGGVHLDSVSVQLLAEFEENSESEGRQLWFFHASKIDSLTSDRVRLIGGLCYRVQFGIRQVYDHKFFETEGDAIKCRQAFVSVAYHPPWSDIRTAISRAMGLLWFAFRGTIARAARWLITHLPKPA